MNKLAHVIFNILHRFSLKKTNVVVSFGSINEYMPEQEENIIKAAEIIYKQNSKDKVLIKAVKPNTVELVIKPKKIGSKKEVKEQISDIRNMLAQKALYKKQNECIENSESSPKKALNKLNERYLDELEKIRQTPFNFSKAILKTYKNIQNEEIKELA